jgi:Fe-S cluster assembly protein SufD
MEIAVKNNLPSWVDSMPKTSVWKGIHESDGIIDPFPTTRIETWKYTRVGRIENQNWKATKEPSTKLNSSLQLVNGFLQLNKSISGVEVLNSSNFNSEIKTRISEIWKEESIGDVFSGLCENFATSISAIRIEKNLQIEEPIEICVTSEDAGTIIIPVVYIVCEQNCNVQFSLKWLNEKGGNFHLPHFIFDVKDGAHFSFDMLQNAHNESVLLTRTLVLQEANSTSSLSCVTTNAIWVRNELTFRVNGEGAQSNLVGAYFPKQGQFIDNHTCVDHRVPNCESNELYKGVLFENGKGVFNGKVFVRKDAQKTNAYQNNANIIMSDEAQMNTKPELEIYADDVKCSHGTTTGQFDEEALFYLRARGFSMESAKMLLISAFTSDVISRIHNQQHREYVIQELKNRELITE